MVIQELIFKISIEHIFIILRVSHIPSYLFYLGRVSKDFTKNQVIETVLNGVVYQVLVDFCFTDIENMLNNLEDLIKKYIIKKSVY